VPWLVVTKRGRRFSKSSLHYYWNPVRAAFGRPGMDFYELRHFCATHLLELGVSHADVAIQLGHTDGGALVMSTYGHPSEDLARERLKRAYMQTVTPLRAAEGGSQKGRKVV
jgi:integrase